MLRDERPPFTLSQTCMAPRLRMKPHSVIQTPRTGDNKDTEGVPARRFRTVRRTRGRPLMPAAADALTSAATTQPATETSS